MWSIRGAYARMGEAEAWKARERLRLAACRKLDATVTGYESFARHAMLAGDPSSKVCDKVLGLELKIGTVKDAVYGQEKKVSGIPGALQEIRAVRFAERALLPFVPEEEDAAAWGVRYALWKELESARAFEEGCKWLLLPAMVCVTSPILSSPGPHRRTTSSGSGRRSWSRTAWGTRSCASWGSPLTLPAHSRSLSPLIPRCLNNFAARPWRENSCWPGSRDRPRPAARFSAQRRPGDPRGRSLQPQGVPSVPPGTGQ